MVVPHWTAPGNPVAPNAPYILLGILAAVFTDFGCHAAQTVSAEPIEIISPERDASDGGEDPSVAAAGAALRDAAAASARAEPEAERFWFRAFELSTAEATATEVRAGLLVNLESHFRGEFEGGGDDRSLLLAFEFGVRLRELGDGKALDSLLREHQEALARVEIDANRVPRFAVTLIDAMPYGSAVRLDGKAVCGSPCMVPVPVDGVPHTLSIPGRGDVAWTPSSADATRPP